MLYKLTNSKNTYINPKKITFIRPRTSMDNKDTLYEVGLEDGNSMYISEIDMKDILDYIGYV